MSKFLARFEHFHTDNTALLSALSGVTFEKAYTAPTEWGRWVESAVGAHILNYAEEQDYKVYYWRAGDKEVDFVIVSNGQSVAIEVKSGHRTTNAGLPEFVARFYPKRSFVVGSGGVPVDEFLQWNPGEMFRD